MVCTSNPSLMKGLFCPEIGSFSTDHLPAKLTALPTNIFSYARAGKPVSGITIRKIAFTIRKIVFIISKIIFIIRKIIFPLI